VPPAEEEPLLLYVATTT
jgi:hypothetical protein